MDGIVVIDKPKGQTSHDIVQKIKRKTGEKIGHTGTLDPLATGVLPILIGKATKISKYLVEHDKTYEVVLKLGEKTSTADAEGEVIEVKEVPVWSKEEVEEILQTCVGKQNQVPPMYSAIKVKGKKLYEYARKGETVEVPTREIEIYRVELKDTYEEGSKEIPFVVSCSKGTYIRSFCETIAEKLKTVGYMKELRRTRVGRFTLKDAITAEELEQIEENVYTIESLFKEEYPTYVLPKSKKEAFLNGMTLEAKQADGVVCIYEENGLFLGLGTIQNGRVKRDVIL